MPMPMRTRSPPPLREGLPLPVDIFFFCCHCHQATERRRGAARRPLLADRDRIRAWGMQRERETRPVRGARPSTSASALPSILARSNDLELNLSHPPPPPTAFRTLSTSWGWDEQSAVALRLALRHRSALPFTALRAETCTYGCMLMCTVFNSRDTPPLPRFN
jgi:hypothetical protein